MAGFWVDVYTSAGVKETGTTFNVSNVQIQDSVNRIGQASFTVPVGVLTDINPLYAKRYKLYSEQRGYLGSYRHRTLTIDADGMTATIVCDDSLFDLAAATVGFNRSYGDGNTVKGVISDLAAAISWSVIYEPAFDNDAVSCEFQGESFLTAFDTMRAYVRGWFRRDGDTVVRFGRYRNLGYFYTKYRRSPHNNNGETTTTASPAPGATALNVVSIVDFDESGTLEIQVPSIAYSAKGATTFTVAALSAAQVNALQNGTPIQQGVLITRTTATPSIGAVTVTVESTTGFTASGNIQPIPFVIYTAFNSGTQFAVNALTAANASLLASGATVLQGILTIYGQYKYRGQTGTVDPAEISARLANEELISNATPRTSVTASAVLTANAVISATTIAVDSTLGFAASGTITISGLTTTYSSKTQQAFTVPAISAVKAAAFKSGAIAYQGTFAAYSLITKLTQLVDGTSVTNRVYPIGAGLGITQINLGRCTPTLPQPYPIQSAVNADATLRYYIEDAGSVATYGAVERVLPFNDVRPITNSLADVQAAADTLYALAYAYVRKFSQPFSVYQVECVNLSESARPGSIVTIEYRGVVDLPGGRTAYLFLNRDPFYILERTANYGDTGDPTYTLTVSSNGEGNVSSEDIFRSAVRDIDRFKARPIPTQTFYTKANPTLGVSAQSSTNARVDVHFPFVIGDETLFINDMVLEMYLSRFVSYTATSISTGAITAGPSVKVSDPTQPRNTADGNIAYTSGASSTDGYAIRNSADNNLQQTSNDGGGVSTSTDSNSTDVHNHQIEIQNGAVGNIVYTDGNYLYSFSGNNAINQTSSYSLNSHKHGFSFGAHSHTIEPHSHGIAHVHLIAPHLHGIDHTHAINSSILVSTPGIVTPKNAGGPIYPQNVTSRLNGLLISNWTVASNVSAASTDGTNCSGEGLFRANITALFPGGGGTVGAVVKGDYRLDFVCGINFGLVFAQLLGRETIQSIAT